jgi:hypothetical protein
MKVRYTTSLVIIVLLSVASVAAAMQTAQPERQLDQRAIAQQLLAEDKQERDKAFDASSAIAPANTSQELRLALITLLDRENRIVLEAARRGVTVDTLEDPEFIAAVSRTVAALRDTRAIRVLAGALGMGTVLHPLTEFGELAVPLSWILSTPPEPTITWSMTACEPYGS